MIPRILQWLFPCFLWPKQEKVCSHIPCILHWLCRCILGGIFIYTGYIKIGHSLEFTGVINGYKLFPAQYHFYIAEYFPCFEITLGILLLIGFRRKIRYIAAIAVALLLFFIVILIITNARGIEANCGCFSLDDRISPKTIARDSLILIPALYLLLAGPLLRRRQKN
jgi:putative oxidoreductase